METVLQARIAHPAFAVAGAMDALQGLHKAISRVGLDERMLELLNLRASQINGCSVCVGMHSRELKKAGETDERVFAVAAWRAAPYFTEAEHAALALAETVTRLDDRPGTRRDLERGRPAL